MNKTILLSTALFASVVAATVLAAPQIGTTGETAGGAPNRAVAYQLAIAN